MLHMNGLRSRKMKAILEYLEDLYNKGKLSDEEWFDIKNLIEEDK